MAPRSRKRILDLPHGECVAGECLDRGQEGGSPRTDPDGWEEDAQGKRMLPRRPDLDASILRSGRRLDRYLPEAGRGEKSGCRRSLLSSEPAGTAFPKIRPPEATAGCLEGSSWTIAVTDPDFLFPDPVKVFWGFWKPVRPFCSPSRRGSDRDERLAPWRS